MHPLEATSQVFAACTDALRQDCWDPYWKSDGREGVELVNQKTRTESGHESLSCSAVSWEVSHYGGERRGTGQEEGS